MFGIISESVVTGDMWTAFVDIRSVCRTDQIHLEIYKLAEEVTEVTTNLYGWGRESTIAK